MTVSTQFQMTLSLKRSFFDRAAIQRPSDQATVKTLGKMGAFIRRRARSILRRKKKVSSVGSPPSVHSSDPVATLKNVLFALGPDRRSVLVGPVKLNQVNLQANRMGSLTVPQLHEFGGTIAIREWSFGPGKPWRRRDMRFNPRPGWMYRTRNAKYAPRPFMGPAGRYELERGKMAEQFRKQVGRAA